MYDILMVGEHLCQGRGFGALACYMQQFESALYLTPMLLV